MNPLPVKVNNMCVCELCEGKYLQVDPVNCACTECITGEYRPAINQEDYDVHNGDATTQTTTLLNEE